MLRNQQQLDMKKIMFLAIVLAMAVPAKAQETVYIYMQYRQVDPSQSAEFERREIEYWSKVEKAAMDKGDMILQSEAYWFNRGNKYWVWNYGQPDDVQGFIDENKTLWGPWFQRHAKEGNIPTKSWELYRVLAPAKSKHASVLTIDGFDTYSDAIQHCGGVLLPNDLDGWEDIQKNSNMSEIMPDGFGARVVYQRIHSVYVD